MRSNAKLFRMRFLTNLILNSFTLLLVDNLALSLGVCCAFLLIHWITLVVVRGTAFLIVLGGALFFMNGFMDSSWDVDALQLRNTVALLVLNSGTLLPCILCGFTLFLVLKSALFTGNRFLDRSLSNLTLALLNFGTDSVRNASAILLGNGFVGRLRNLVTDFLGNLSTNWFRWRSSPLDRRRVKLERQVGKS